MLFTVTGRFALLLLLSLPMLTACSEPDLQAKPNNAFWKIGMWGHGRGLLGDLRINYFGVQRRCDTCHAASTSSHGDLGTCNRCHQPHVADWSKSLLPKDHGEVFQLEGNRYHNKLACRSCHKKVNSQDEYKMVECSHCHNHGRSDMDYAHDLLDDYDYQVYSNNELCRDCHVKNGSRYSELYDVLSGELL